MTASAASDASICKAADAATTALTIYYSIITDPSLAVWFVGCHRLSLHIAWDDIAGLSLFQEFFAHSSDIAGLW